MSKLHVSFQEANCKVEDRKEFEKIVRINILLLQMTGLLRKTQGWTNKLVSNMLSLCTYMVLFATTTTSVLNIAVGHYDVATVCECVSIFSIYYRYIVVCRQDSKLADLLLICNEIWAILTISEKETVR